MARIFAVMLICRQRVFLKNHFTLVFSMNFWPKLQSFPSESQIRVCLTSVIDEMGGCKENNFKDLPRRKFSPCYISTGLTFEPRNITR